MPAAAEILALMDKHAPPAAAKVGLSPNQVRSLVLLFTREKRRDRRRRTPRGKKYGWVKKAAANIPADGIVVPSVRMADTLRTVAGRMGIKLTVFRIGAGPTRIVMPALTDIELSLLSSQL